MSRLIDAEETYRVLTDYYHHRTDGQHEALREALERVPSAQHTGHWEAKDDEVFAPEYYCNQCGNRAEVDLYGEWILSDFCPKCGADMREVTE